MNKLLRTMEDNDIEALTKTLCELGRIHQGVEQTAYYADYSFHIGDLIAKSEYPSLITHRYGGKEKGEIQGYRLGPILIVRLHKDSEQAIALWLEPNLELESKMTDDALSSMLILRETLNGFNLRNNVEIPSEQLENLAAANNPFIIRDSTFAGLTAPAGRALPFGVRLILAMHIILPGLIHNAHLIGRDVLALREQMFSKYDPMNRRVMNAAADRTSCRTGPSDAYQRNYLEPKTQIQSKETGLSLES